MARRRTGYALRRALTMLFMVAGTGCAALTPLAPITELDVTVSARPSDAPKSPDAEPVSWPQQISVDAGSAVRVSVHVQNNTDIAVSGVSLAFAVDPAVVPISGGTGDDELDHRLLHPDIAREPGTVGLFSPLETGFAGPRVPLGDIAAGDNTEFELLVYIDTEAVKPGMETKHLLRARASATELAPGTGELTIEAAGVSSDATEDIVARHHELLAMQRHNDVVGAALDDALPGSIDVTQYTLLRVDDARDWALYAARLELSLGDAGEAPAMVDDSVLWLVVSEQPEDDWAPSGDFDALPRQADWSGDWWLLPVRPVGDPTTPANQEQGPTTDLPADAEIVVGDSVQPDDDRDVVVTAIVPEAVYEDDRWWLVGLAWWDGKTPVPIALNLAPFPADRSVPRSDF